MFKYLSPKLEKIYIYLNNNSIGDKIENMKYFSDGLSNLKSK